VVLPTPPLELATNTVFIRNLRTGNEGRAYTGDGSPASSPGWTAGPGPAN